MRRAPLVCLREDSCHHLVPHTGWPAHLVVTDSHSVEVHSSSSSVHPIRIDAASIAEVRMHCLPPTSSYDVHRNALGCCLTLGTFSHFIVILCTSVQTWRASPDVLGFRIKESEAAVHGTVQGSETIGKSFLLKCLSSNSRQHLDMLQNATRSQPDPEVGRQDALLSVLRLCTARQMEEPSCPACRRDTSSAGQKLHLPIFIFTTTAYCNTSTDLHHLPVHSVRPVQLCCNTRNTILLSSCVMNGFVSAGRTCSRT